ncbi:MAG: DMT family transporter [Cryomorphaceae bacterium]|nr:DMT family transporter [Cryomorphaceae bacterium]
MTKEIRSWILLLLLACIWGSSFILMKKGMFTSSGSQIFTSAQVGSLRMLLASLVLLPFAIPHIRKITSFKRFLSLATVGFCGNFIPAFLFTYAETGLSSGLAGMLNSTTPIFTILIGFIIFNVRISTLQIIGISIGTVGVVLLMLAGKQLSLTGTWYHILAIVLATLMYAISLNTIKHMLYDMRSVEITSLAFFIVFIPALISSFYFGAFDTLNKNEHAWDGLSFILILSVVGTALAVFVFNYVISYSSALFASTVTYFIPIVAVLIGVSFGEMIGWTEIGAMAIVLGGVFTANYLPYFLQKMRAKENN